MTKNVLLGLLKVMEDLASKGTDPEIIATGLRSIAKLIETEGIKED